MPAPSIEPVILPEERPEMSSVPPALVIKRAWPPVLVSKNAVSPPKLLVMVALPAVLVLSKNVNPLKFAGATGLSSSRVHQLLNAPEGKEIPVWLSQPRQSSRGSGGKKKPNGNSQKSTRPWPRRGFQKEPQHFA